ncbi:MAG: cytochrome c3 family protein [Acidobacteriia bacterium]|nr:cytochrome c3 family protein [Terriglobia bacterium]
MSAIDNQIMQARDGGQARGTAPARASQWMFLLAVAIWIVVALFAASRAHAAALPPAVQSTCVDCHSALDANLKVTGEQYAQDIHAQKGLTCAACHGGDPTSMEAMDKKKGFKGHIDRKAIPELCAKCHADGAYMRQYNPSLRTDQLAQYKTSVHGKRLAGGDSKVAVCIDCHGVHGIRAVKDPRSKVYPLNVADTCARCHADGKYMQAYPIKHDQFAGYSSSVHHDALAVRGDLSAPTCTTCHGNHGAAPPGVASVTNVCSTCHVFQAQLFDTSPHKAAFAAAGLPGCVTCHSNHRITHPSDAMVGTGPQAVCTQCHSQGDAGFAVAGKIQQQFAALQNAIVKSDEVLTRAEQSGMEVSQAQLDLTSARDQLTKARVTLHSFTLAKIDADVKVGQETAEKTRQAGEKALRERDYRRAGLGISLLTIVAMLIGLKLYISRIESRK